MSGSLLWLNVDVAFIVLAFPGNLEEARWISAPRLPRLLADPDVVSVRKSAPNAHKGAISRDTWATREIAEI